MTLEYKQDPEFTELLRRLEHLEALMQRTLDLALSTGHVLDALLGRVANMQRSLAPKRETRRD